MSTLACSDSVPNLQQTAQWPVRDSRLEKFGRSCDAADWLGQQFVSLTQCQLL